MSNEKSPVALTTFITNLFHNLPKLLLTNLLFARKGNYNVLFRY